MAGVLDLQDWNESIKGFGDTPDRSHLRSSRLQDTQHAARVVNNTSHQSATREPQRIVRSFDPHALRAQGLDHLPNATESEFWIHRAAVEEHEGNITAAIDTLIEGLRRDARPISTIIQALHDLQEHYDIPVIASGLENYASHKQHTNSITINVPPQPASSYGSPRSLTPTRLGLHGSAFRLPTHLANTPHSKEAQQVREMPPPTKAFTGILKKKLEFSAHRSSSSGGGGMGASNLGVPSRLATTTTTTAAANPETATKQRLFGHTTTPGHHYHHHTTTIPRNIRRVTFDGSIISPATGAGGTTAVKSMRRLSQVSRSSSAHFSTPEVAIKEGEDEEERGNAAGRNITAANMGTNSTNAGHTPYSGSRKTSSLFKKYGPQGNPVIITNQSAEHNVMEEIALEAVKPDSPSWEHLSSGSVAESIKILTQKYAASPSPLEEEGNDNNGHLERVREEEEEEEEEDKEDKEGCYHDVIGDDDHDTIKAIHQPITTTVSPTPTPPPSSPSISPAAVAPTPHDKLTPMLQDNIVYEESSPLAMKEDHYDVDVVPASPLIDQIFNPLINQEEQEEEEDNRYSYGNDNGPTTPLSVDGVPRDETGIPIFTPASVTIFRGGSAVAGPQGLDVGMMGMHLFSEEMEEEGGVENDENTFSFYPQAAAADNNNNDNASPVLAVDNDGNLPVVVVEEGGGEKSESPEILGWTESQIKAGRGVQSRLNHHHQGNDLSIDVTNINNNANKISSSPLPKPLFASRTPTGLTPSGLDLRPQRIATPEVTTLASAGGNATNEDASLLEQMQLAAIDSNSNSHGGGSGSGQQQQQEEEEEPSASNKWSELTLRNMGAAAAVTGVSPSISNTPPAAVTPGATPQHRYATRSVSKAASSAGRGGGLYGDVEGLTTHARKLSISPSPSPSPNEGGAVSLRKNSKSSKSGSGLKLSPTEQNIRDSLRKSARKSTS
jgi:hypothetical protein